MAGLRTLLILTCALATLASWAKADTACPRAAPAPGAAATGAPATRLSGTIVKIEGAQLTVKTRTGEEVSVYARPALDAQQSTLLLVGRSVDILGTLAGPNGLVYADAIRRAKDDPAGWPPDCPPAS
jgi:predicted outer membrane protein